MKLHDRTIVITGGTSGIGRGLAEHFAALNNTVIVCGRRQERLAELTARQPRIVTRRCDVSVDAERVEFVRWLLDAHPDVDMLINNAGVQLRLDPSRPIDLARVRQELELNIVAPLHLSGLLAGHLANRDATIVNVTSGLAFVPLAEVAVYSATKAALHSLTMTMRHRLNGTVRVIELVPPAVDTELGTDRRTDPTATHGGMPLDEFLSAAITGLAATDDEILVGGAANMRTAPDELFTILNNR
jgi:uncharacterized oxidoreductase